MRKYLTRWVVIASAAFLAFGAVAAYAYWTTSGSGTGTASAGDISNLSITQTSSLSPMHPGDSAQTLAGTITNSNSGPVFVQSVTASIASVEASGDCDASDFALTDAVMDVNAEVAVGDTAFSGAHIQFNNKASVNQDGCKGAVVHLSYSVDQ